MPAAQDSLDSDPVFFSPQDRSSALALKQRYRILTKLYHPDRHPGRVEWATDMMRRINEAYVQLQDVVSSETTSGTEMPETLIARGDESLRRAVIMGWLNRVPRGEGGHRRIILACRDALASHPFRSFDQRRIDFFASLFDLFLKATEWGIVRPLPRAGNSTRFFKDLRTANSLLDKGIRDFYHHRDRGRLEALAAVPLSYLEDAVRYYSYLHRKAAEPANREVIKSRIEIARAFQRRIREMETASPA